MAGSRKRPDWLRRLVAALGVVVAAVAVRAVFVVAAAEPVVATRRVGVDVVAATIGPFSGRFLGSVSSVAVTGVGVVSATEVVAIHAGPIPERTSPCH